MTDPEPTTTTPSIPEIDSRVMTLCRVIDHYYHVWDRFRGYAGSDCATRLELEQAEDRVLQAKVVLTQLLRRADENAP